jgi:hypothetical protein
MAKKSDFRYYVAIQATYGEAGESEAFWYDDFVDIGSIEALYSSVIAKIQSASKIEAKKAPIFYKKLKSLSLSFEAGTCEIDIFLEFEQDDKTIEVKDSRRNANAIFCIKEEEKESFEKWLAIINSCSLAVGMPKVLTKEEEEAERIKQELIEKGKQDRLQQAQDELNTPTKKGVKK